MQKQPRLLDQVRECIRYKHYSIRTEKSYLDWIRRFIFFHGKKNPVEMGAAEIEAFLTHLAVQGIVSASTRNQTWSVILFLYREVPAVDLPRLSNFRRVRESQKLPVVLTEDEVRSVRVYLDGIVEKRFAERILPLDIVLLRTWADLSANAELTGRKLPVMDALLMATAQYHSLIIVTRNIQDFNSFPHLFNPWPLFYFLR